MAAISGRRQAPHLAAIPILSSTATPGCAAADATPKTEIKVRSNTAGAEPLSPGWNGLLKPITEY
jgi:hypothetical protein